MNQSSDLAAGGRAVGVGKRAPTMSWNLWLGCGPEQNYSAGIAPFKWRGFGDYGCGALGDMGCRLLDAPFWALNLRGPVKVSAESNGSTEMVALGNLAICMGKTIEWDPVKGECVGMSEANRFIHKTTDCFDSLSL